MASLLQATNETTVLGNTISLKMVSFIENVKDQPAGFRDLGLEFLSTCQILNALTTSLTSHFETGQTFPEQAIPELTRVLGRTTDDFKHLKALLQKFMDYENGGAFARLQKTWRIMFADKDIAKVKTSLQASKGALNMTMLLTNINPNGGSTPTGYEYGMLAAKLNQATSADRIAEPAPSTVISEMSGESRLPQELPVNEPKYRDVEIRQHTPVTESSYGELTPSVSEISVSDQVPEPSVVSAIDSVDQQRALHHERAPDLASEPKVLREFEQTMESEASQSPPRIHVNRSTLTFLKPTSNLGATNASLQNALLSALNTQKHAIITQLLSRGVPPTAAALIVAIRERDLTSLNLLLSYGADPNVLAADGNTPLRYACQFRDRDPLIESLLQYGADPNVSAPDYTPLAFALLEKHEKSVSMLLTYGADPNLIMKSGTTGLLHACDRDYVPEACVVEMLRYGADPNVKSKDGTTCLYSACIRNRPTIVSLLLSHGADPNVKGTELPIVPAVRYPDCLSVLIANKADVTLRKGILEVAVQYNKEESVKLLLRAGVNPNEKTDNLFSPITTAIRNNKPEILGLLLQHGADPNLKGQEMPLYMAAKVPALLKQLLNGGADPKIQKGVMEMAVYYNSVESVQILLDAGVSPNDKKDNLFTPLTTAIRDSRIEILKLLLANGADPNFKGQDVPLYMATKKPEILKLLLECPRTDLAKAKGVMEMAVFYNSIDSVRILLEAGVDPNEKKDALFTPLTTAIRDGRSEILDLLLKSGADVNLKGQDLPLALAAKKPGILKQLLDGGADLGTYPGIIGIAVQEAVRNEDTEAIDILHAAGAKIDEKRHDTYTPLGTALANNKPGIITHLFSKGADPNVPTHASLPLIMAAGYRDADQERLKLLLDKGADVNAAGPGGKTALMEACQTGIEGNVHLLLDKGADVETVDAAGRSAMDFAASAGRDEIVMMLLERMG